jgi:hypothetical protein
MKLKELKGREVLGLTKLPGEFDYDVESKMKGKKYFRYAVDGQAFAVETTSPFVKNQEDGEIYSLKFELNADSKLSLASYTTLTGEFKMAEFEAKIEGLKTINTRPSVAVNDEELIG